jgi:hypothetical protein
LTGSKRLSISPVSPTASLTILLLASIAGVSVCAAEPKSAAQAVPGSLIELLDLRSLSMRKAWQSYQQSSVDPAGGFYDSSHFVRVDNDRKLVAIDVDGPGCSAL